MNSEDVINRKRKKKKRNKKNRKSKSDNIDDETMPTSSNESSVTGSSDDLVEEIRQADYAIEQTLTQEFHVRHDSLPSTDCSNGGDFVGFPDPKKRKHEDMSNRTRNIKPIQDKSNSIDVPNYVRFLYLQTKNPTQILRKINPFVLRQAVELISDGPIKSARYCKSGSLLIETFSNVQTKKLLNAKSIINDTVPIEVTIAKNLNTVQGTVYAPELEDLSEYEILNYLQPSI